MSLDYFVKLESKKELKKSIQDDLLFGLDINVFGFPGGSVMKNPLPMQEMWVQSLGQEDPLE